MVRIKGVSGPEPQSAMQQRFSFSHIAKPMASTSRLYAVLAQRQRSVFLYLKWNRKLVIRLPPKLQKKRGSNHVTKLSLAQEGLLIFVSINPYLISIHCCSKGVNKLIAMVHKLETTQIHTNTILLIDQYHSFGFPYFLFHIGN